MMGNLAGFWSVHSRPGGSRMHVYVSGRDEILSAGTDGELALLDVRQRRRRLHLANAHRTDITCIAATGGADCYFITASLDGEVKVGLKYLLLFTFKITEYHWTIINAIPLYSD